MHYKPTGVCSQNIEFDIEDNKVKNVHFTGGCNGNLQGIARLVEGMDVFRRVDFPEHVYCKGRSRNDCICIQLSGKDRCT